VDTVFVLVLGDVFVDNESLAFDLLFEMTSFDSRISTLHLSKLNIPLILITHNLD